MNRAIEKKSITESLTKVILELILNKFVRQFLKISLGWVKIIKTKKRGGKKKRNQQYLQNYWFPSPPLVIKPHTKGTQAG